MSDELEALRRYQRLVLASLHEATSPHDALARLKQHADAEPFAEDVASFEPRALEMGMSLARQWSIREPGPPPSVSAERCVRFVRPGSSLELGYAEPRRIGPRQVRIAVAACGICGTDKHIQSGELKAPASLILGHEIVGTVRECGKDVTDLEVGTRVGVPWIQDGCSGATCGACAHADDPDPFRCHAPITWLDNGGGLAQSVIAEAAGCRRIPDGLSFEHAAPLFCAGHTAISAYHAACVQPGDRIAVIGIGGIGHLALQIARAFGHRPIAVTSSSSKGPEALTFGAGDVIGISGPAELKTALVEIGGADVIISTTDNMALVAAAASALRADGRLVSVAMGSEPLPLDARSLVLKRARVIGARPHSYAELDELLKLAAAGSVLPQVEVFPLSRVNQALVRLEEGVVRYRAVIKIS